MIALLLSQVTVESIISLFRQTDLAGVLLGAALYLVINGVRSARVAAICRLPIRDSLRAYTPSLASSFGNNVLPARAGEPIFVWAAHTRLNMDWGAGAAVMVAMRVFDTLMVALIFIITAVAQHDSTAPAVLQATVWVLIGCVALTALLPWIGPYGVSGLAHATRLTRQPRLIAFVDREGRQAADTFSRLRSLPVYAGVIGTSAVIWVLTFWWIYLLIRSIGIALPFGQAVTGSTFGILSKAIPFSSIGGWGAHEVGWTAGFMLTGMPRELAISSGFAVNTLIILTSAVCGLPAWLALTNERKRSTIDPGSPHEEAPLHPKLAAAGCIGDRLPGAGDARRGD